MAMVEACTLARLAQTSRIAHSPCLRCAPEPAVGSHAQQQLPDQCLRGQPVEQVSGNGGGVSVTGTPGTGWPPAFYYPCNAQGSCEWFTPTAVHPAGYAPYVPWTSPNTHPTFERCTFRNNYAAMGAGVFAYEASLTMSDCTIDRCEGESQGGGIYSAHLFMHVSAGAPMYLPKCLCSSASDAVCSDLIDLATTATYERRGAGRFSSWHFDRLNMTNNIAKGAGAALMGEYTIADHLDSLVITGNNADTFGGALNANFAFMVFTNAFVDNNYAGLFCGGLFAIFSELFVFNSMVSHNTCGLALTYRNALPACMSCWPTQRFRKLTTLGPAWDGVRVLSCAQGSHRRRRPEEPAEHDVLGWHDCDGKWRTVWLRHRHQQRRQYGHGLPDAGICTELPLCAEQCH